MSFSCRYVALYVTALEAAEAFYRRVFEMDVLFRESLQDDGEWYTLRSELDWSEARELGVGIDMVALRRGDFVLALFPGEPSAGTVYEICVAVDAAELGATRARLPENVVVEESSAGWLRFVDPFGFRWAVRDHTLLFRSSGELAGRWLG